MSSPKLHHYVPQFYLRRFIDASGRLWVWERDRDRVFPTGPASIAAGTNFYFLSTFVEQGHDPLTMERQFADIEHSVSAVTGQWLEWIRQGQAGDLIAIPDPNREIFSLYLALQFLRTDDTRSTLSLLSAEVGYAVNSEEERRALHVDMLWDDQLISSFAGRVRDSTWLFAQNKTCTPFITSDNPVAFRTANNQMWLKAAIMGGGTYVVYPLSPDVMMYCYPDEPPWKEAGISRFDCQISPVTLTDEMVQSENTAQVFMASRFVIGNRGTFDMEREFAKTIGTDHYRPRS